jgi:hypothetical protein
LGRRLIESNIIEAWYRCVKNDYSRQRINSERSLQASFGFYLNKLLPPDQRLFIEPRVAVTHRAGIKKLHPDIVVCRKRLVTAIVELKYLPKTRPNYKKDIESLAFISKYRDKIFISNSRYRGPETGEGEYKLSKRILFVYACVHKDMRFDEYPLYAAGYKSLSGRYLQLHAETRADSKPKIFFIK